MSITDHLTELAPAIRRPKLKKLVIPYNGIETEYCEYFKHIFSFDTLEELNISCNWFGMRGLARFRQHLVNLSKLRHLNISNNKLCADEGHDTRELRDALLSVKDTVEELFISEN